MSGVRKPHFRLHCTPHCGGLMWSLHRPAAGWVGGGSNRARVAIAAYMELVYSTSCLLGARGWLCTRANGHAGPCALVPVPRVVYRDPDAADFPCTLPCPTCTGFSVEAMHDCVTCDGCGRVGDPLARAREALHLAQRFLGNVEFYDPVDDGDEEVHYDEVKTKVDAALALLAGYGAQLGA